jgi:hypothetical protein
MPGEQAGKPYRIDVDVLPTTGSSGQKDGDEKNRRKKKGGNETSTAAREFRDQEVETSRQREERERRKAE